MSNLDALKEICAGLEEEGVLYAIFSGHPDTTDDLTSKASDATKASIQTYHAIDIANARILAHNAANHSRLHVGIGINGKSAAMQMRNCPADKPVFQIETDNPREYRNLGTNAARAVKGVMFI